LHFFIIGLIEYYTEDIICSDLSNIPSLISSITLKSYEMINEIFDNAIKLRAITPYSFRLMFEEMEIFKKKCLKHKENYDKFKPESILCLPILPCEIFCITYTNIIKCPDKKCLNFIDLKELSGEEECNIDMELNVKIDNKSINYNDNRSEIRKSKSNLSDLDKKKWIYNFEEINHDNENNNYNHNYNDNNKNKDKDKNENKIFITLGNNFETFGNKENGCNYNNYYNEEEEYESVRGYSK
jgi:hypothetical protein